MNTQARMTQEAIDMKEASYRRFNAINKKIRDLLKERNPLYLAAFKASSDHFRRFVLKEGVMAELEFEGGSMAHQIGCIRQEILMRDRCKVLEHMYRQLKGDI